MISIFNNTETISDLVHKIEDLKEKYRYYQRCQEHARHNILFWDPYDGLDKEQHEIYWSCVIGSNKLILTNIQNEIKEVRKQIKKLNREQNIKNNKKKTV